ncbi:BARP protein [Trypanosoma brucei brucei TREU927]|uniref:BARP protein n=1 Tax=Trypanosoma brucei brucei (strain 927/4 GUTat10.1) TaxID=185431 RepID=Q38CW2_TRYB2|nr:bloodstream stage alanine-rich protein BARP [Trypanosoma brucei brucei TREU927]EAN77358.1 BARP protein [Trypanosoma brucei brucei TREU927]
MSITFNNLWLLLTVLCTARIRADFIGEECLDIVSYPSADVVRILCHVAGQLRGLSQTVSSAVETAAAASSKAFEAKVQAEEAVELAESRGLNVTKAKEAAVRATHAAEAAALAASNLAFAAANIAAVPWSQPISDSMLHKLALCDHVDEYVREAAKKCTKKAKNVTAQSLNEVLKAFEKLFSEVNALQSLRHNIAEFHKDLKSLEDHVEDIVRAQKNAEDAAAETNKIAAPDHEVGGNKEETPSQQPDTNQDQQANEKPEANQTAGTNTGPLGNSVASPEGSVLLLMAGLFLGSVL